MAIRSLEKKKTFLIHKIGKDYNKVPISIGQLQFDDVKKREGRDWNSEEDC